MPRGAVRTIGILFALLLFTFPVIDAVMTPTRNRQRNLHPTSEDICENILRWLGTDTFLRSGWYSARFNAIRNMFCSVALFLAGLVWLVAQGASNHLLGRDGDTRHSKNLPTVSSNLRCALFRLTGVSEVVWTVLIHLFFRTSHGRMFARTFHEVFTLCSTSPCVVLQYIEWTCVKCGSGLSVVSKGAGKARRPVNIIDDNVGYVGVERRKRCANPDCKATHYLNYVVFQDGGVRKCQYYGDQWQGLAYLKVSAKVYLTTSMVRKVQHQVYAFHSGFSGVAQCWNVSYGVGSKLLDARGRDLELGYKLFILALREGNR